MAEESKVCTTCGRRYGDEALFCPKDGSALVASAGSGQGKDPFLGREILGHIEILSLIGSGAMGRVYRAHQRGIDRDVAVKILHRDLAQNPDLVARFLREAKVASRLNHGNVVQVLLAGQLDDGTMYLVMEFLDGISLQSALLAAGGSLPLTRALHVMLQVCDAVGQAHEANVIHRDVKPENVMLVKRGDDLDFVKVLDFGIARLASGDPGRSGVETQAGLVFGTARYLSPEGARGEPVGPQSDCYAIATVLYQALAGRTPFESDSSVSLLVAQIHDPPPPLRQHARAANVPPAVEAVVMRNLAKDPARRDPDAHAFGRALLEAATESGMSAEDLILRPAVARARRAGSGGSLPAAAVSMSAAISASSNASSNASSAVLSGTAGVTPPPGLANQKPLANTQTQLAPAGLAGLSGPNGAATPAPAPAARPGPDGLYHPSYSGKALPGTPAPPPGRRVAKTLDEDAEPRAASPVGAAPAIGAPHVSPVSPLPAAGELGAGTIVMPPAAGAEESILGTASAPREEYPAGVPRRGRVAALLLVAALAGVAGVGIAAYRLGWVGPAKVDDKKAQVEDLLVRARAALDARRWDKPSGDNVVELTDQILAIAPSETRAFAIRNSAADRIVREALDRKAHDDFAAALALYRVAAKLSPPDKGLQEEIEEVEAEVAKNPTTVALVTDGGAARFTASTKIGGDDAIKPNEAATIVATLAGETPKEIDPKAHFTVSGPGLEKPREIEARGETATRYVGSFVFPLNGTYKVHFFARPEGFPVNATAQRQVGVGTSITPTIVPTAKPSAVPTKPTGTWPTKPVGTAPTAAPTVTLTPDPVPLPLPTAPTAVPPPPFPTMP
ncbi:MAG: serine/threonine protein kinase [Deltaproteobacteria bacterium]|nr:serine/threonine protein kinase [Deltaproteobacteria bacterium]